MVHPCLQAARPHVLAPPRQLMSEAAALHSKNPDAALHLHGAAPHKAFQAQGSGCAGADAACPFNPQDASQELGARDFQHELHAAPCTPCTLRGHNALCNLTFARQMGHSGLGWRMMSSVQVRQVDW